MFKESQIFRIDHYLGKETVQNLMALRFANALFEPLWNAAHIDHVQITVAENLGVESRAGYYDTAGALRDMVQNHILQLALPRRHGAAEPVRGGCDARREAEGAALAEAGPAVADRGGDGARPVSRRRLGRRPGPRLSAGARPRRFAPPRPSSRSRRRSRTGAGPACSFYIRTGKRLPSRISEIVVSFKKIPHSIFGDAAGSLVSNQLVMRPAAGRGRPPVADDQGSGPGGMRLRHVPLDMSFAQTFKVRSPEAYERLLMDVIRGNATLFMRRDEVEAAWKLDRPDPRKLVGHRARSPKSYTAGTWGPSAAIALIERDGRTWHEEIE